MIEPVNQALFLRDVIPTLATTAAVIEYLQETGYTNAAATVAAGAAKPQSDLTFAGKSAPMVKMAHWFRVNEDTLLTNLSKEWASLPGPNGKGAYSGQRVAVTADRVRNCLSEVRLRHAKGQPSKVVEKAVPVVPYSVESEVKKQTTGGSWLIGAGGAAGTVMTGAFGADWRTVVAVGGVAIVGLILIFVMRHKIVAAIRDARNEVEP